MKTAVTHTWALLHTKASRNWALLLFFFRQLTTAAAHSLSFRSAQVPAELCFALLRFHLGSTRASVGDGEPPKESLRVFAATEVKGAVDAV